MKQLHTSRKLAIVAVLVVVVSGLLPARPSFAEPARRSASLSAEQPVDVLPEGVRAEFWVANAMDRVDGPRRAEMVAFGLVLLHLYRQNPDLPPAVAAQTIHDLHTAYRNSVQADPSLHTKTANEGLLSVFAVLSTPPLSSSPSAGAVAAAAYEAYTVTLRESNTGHVIGAPRILGASESYLSPLQHEMAQQTLLHEALVFARHSRHFGQAFDTLWSTDLHVSIYAGTRAIIASSPSLQSLTATVELIDTAGAIHTTVGDIQSLLNLEFSRIDRVMTDAQLLLKEISDGQLADMVAAARDEPRKAADKDKAEKADKQASDQLRKAKENIKLLAGFAKYLNPDWAEQIETTGDAGIEITSAISNFARQVADIGAFQALTSVGALTLTGNVIGAVTKLITLFSDDGSKPAPNKQILEQIDRLRNQVKDLSRNMNSRFDRVDKALNRIYATLNDRFNRLDLEIGIIRGDLDAIQITLSDVQKQLDRMEQHLFILLSDGFQLPLLQEMNGSIGFKERTGDDMSYDSYIHSDGPENTFHSWAAFFSSHPVAIGPPPDPREDFEDINVYTQLTRPIEGSSMPVRPLDANINYFSQYIQRRWGFPALSSSTLVNPRIWSLSARAYTELGLDWPGHARRIDPSRATAIIEKGRSLQEALRKITTIDSPTGPAANYALFERLITNYITKTASFDQAVQEVENAYLVDLRTRTDPDRTGTINPWGGANQPLDPANLDSLSIPAAPLCGRTDDPQPLPNNFARTMLVAPFQVAHYLGQPDMQQIVSAISACYDARWVDHRTEFVGWPEPVEVTYAKLQVDLTANYTHSGTTELVRTRAITLREQMIDRDGPDGHQPPLDPRATAKENWTAGENIKRLFEYGSQLTVDNPVSDVFTRVGYALTAHQQAIYQDVIDEMAGIGPVARAAKELTGAKALLDAAVGLGLPRALEADEYLRSFLYGSQALPDEAADKRLTGLWLTAKTALPGHNTRVDIKAQMDTRAGAFREAIKRYLDRISQRAYGESHRMIGTTLDRLTIANTMIRTPALGLSAGKLSFGKQVVGTVSATRTITLTNRGLAAPFSITGISLAGMNTGDFALNSTCGPTLMAGATCTITLTFRPTARGNRAAELRVANNAPGAPHSVWLTGVGVLPAPATNLLPNPGFELDANSDTRPDGWTAHDKVTRSDVLTRSGTYAMRHASATDATYAISSQLMPGVVPGAPYAFAGWVNIPTPATPDPTGFRFRLEVHWRDAAGAVIGISPIKSYTAPTNGAWTRAAAHLVAPAGTARAVLRLVASSLAIPIYVDDVFFGNLLANAGFELDANVDGRPDSWTGNAGATRSDLVKWSGSYAIRQTAGDNASYIIGQRVTGLAPGSVYAISGYVNIPSTLDMFEFRLEMQWRDAGNALLGTTPIKSYTSHTNGAWTVAHANLQAPAGAASGVVRMVASSLNATIYVDSLVLQP